MKKQNTNQAPPPPTFIEALRDKETMSLARLCAGSCLKGDGSFEVVAGAALRLIFSCHSILKNEVGVQWLYDGIMLRKGQFLLRKDEVLESPRYRDELIAHKDRLARIKRDPRFKERVANGKMKAADIRSVILPKASAEQRDALWGTFVASPSYLWPKTKLKMTVADAAHAALLFKQFTEDDRAVIAKQSLREGARKSRKKKAAKAAKTARQQGID